jgi:hypothetical protein
MDKLKAKINDLRKKAAHTSRQIAELERFVDDGIRELARLERRKVHNTLRKKINWGIHLTGVAATCSMRGNGRLSP